MSTTVVSPAPRRRRNSPARVTVNEGPTTTVTTAPPPPALVPRWAAQLFAVAGGLLTLGGLTALSIGVLNNYAASRTGEAQMLARVSGIESLIGPAVNRLSSLESRIDTAAQRRDADTRNHQDRLNRLEAADQAQMDRAAALATTIAGLLPRIEEILRRQERFESRINGNGARATPGNYQPLTLDNLMYPQVWVIEGTER